MRNVNPAYSTAESLMVWLRAHMPADSFIASAEIIAQVKTSDAAMYNINLVTF